MESLCNLISDNIITVIFVFGAILGVSIIGNAFKLSNHKSKIETIIDGKKTKTFINKKTRKTHDVEEAMSVTPETIRDYEKEFNKTCSFYNMYTQLIPIFPLLGILGTVAGLMGIATKDMDVLNESLNIALSSTFLGLIFAIVLKFIVVLIPSKIVNEVEIMLDVYYNKFNDAIALKNISEE